MSPDLGSHEREGQEGPKVAHMVSIANRFDSDDVWAVCSCGWQGAPCDDQGQALLDWNRHVNAGEV